MFLFFNADGLLRRFVLAVAALDEEASGREVLLLLLLLLVTFLSRPLLRPPRPYRGDEGGEGDGKGDAAANKSAESSSSLSLSPPFLVVLLLRSRFSRWRCINLSRSCLRFSNNRRRFW